MEMGDDESILPGSDGYTGGADRRFGGHSGAAGGGDRERAKLLLQQDRYDLAAAALIRALADDPEDSDAHALLAFCYVYLERPKEALTEAQEAVRLSPDLPFPHYALAYIHLRQNRLKPAEAAINEAIRIDPWDPEQFRMLGTIYAESGNWRGALAAAEHGVAIQADHVGCTNLRAQAMIKLKRTAEALQTVDAALRFEPDNSHTHANKGWTVLEAGDPKGAMEHFRESLRLDPANTWARQGMITAIKARNPFYRVVLNYFFAMARLPRQVRFGIIWGLWLGRQFLPALEDRYPALTPYIKIVSVLYFVFCFATWTADPLCNALLRFHPYGRYLLTRSQVVAANWVAGTCALAVIGLVGSLFSRAEGWQILGYGFLIVTYLTAITARVSNRILMWVVGGVAAVLGVVVLLLTIAAFAGGH